MLKKSIIVLNIVIMLIISTTTISAINNSPPSAPGIAGPSQVKVETSYTYQLSSVDPEGDLIFYITEIDGVSSGWMGPYDSGEPCIFSHTWSEQGEHVLKAKAKDEHEAESGWSQLSISCSKTKCSPSNTESEEEPLVEQPLDDSPDDETDPEETTCFLADSKIVVYDPTCLASEQVFLRNIQEIQIGDKVISLNPETGELTYSTVTEVYHHKYDEMKDGYLIINEILRITSNHPVYVNDRYIAADDLKIGDTIFGVTITSIEHVSAQEDSYNIEVEPYNNYLVSVGNTQNNIVPVGNNIFEVEQIIGEPPIAPNIAPGFGLFGDKNNLVQSSVTSLPDQTSTMETQTMETETTTSETGNSLV